MEPRRYLIALAITIYSTVCSAEIYKWVDAEGKAQYSDEPPKHVPYTAVKNEELPHVHRQQPVRVKPHRPAEQGQAKLISVSRSAASLSECKNAKRQAIYAEKRRDRKQAEKYDSWIWKNCKSYDSELRQLSKQLD